MRSELVAGGVCVVGLSLVFGLAFITTVAMTPVEESDHHVGPRSIELIVECLSLPPLSRTLYEQRLVNCYYENPDAFVRVPRLAANS